MLRKLLRLMAYEAMLVLAWFFAGSFSLIFLIREGFSVQEASYFYVLEYVVVTALIVVFSRTGFPRADISMAIGSIVLGISFGGFLFLSDYALLNIVPFLFALAVPFFWIPFNVAMIDLTTTENRGFVISLTFFVMPIVYFIGPLAGGATIQNLGYDVVFAVALLILVSNSILTLLTWRKHAEKYAPKVDFDQLRSFTSSGFFLEGVQEGVFAVAVPLATFFFVGDEFDLGKILAAFGVAGGLMSVFAGKLSDRKGNRMLFINLAVLICGPLLILTAFISDLLLFGLGIGAIYFFLPLFYVFIFALSIDRAESSSSNAIMTREFMLNFGRALGASLCLVATLFMSVQGTFAIAGVSLLLVPLIGFMMRSDLTGNEERRIA